MSFRIGQKVVCITDAGWVTSRTTTNTTGWWIFKTTTTRMEWVDFIGPSKGEVCTITGFADDGSGCLKLREYAGIGAYHPGAFRPFDPLEKQLDELEKQVVEQPQEA